MPVKRRTSKAREQLSDNARAWLRGEECGFFQFKNDDELIPLWENYGDPNVATWDRSKHSHPVANSNR